MNRLVLTLSLLLSFGVTLGQTFRKPDKSPMDMAYFPDNFAHDRKPGENAIINE